MKKCSTQDLSLKSYFLGPQSENSLFLQSSFLEILTQYCDWRKSLFPTDGSAISKTDQLDPRFLEKQKRLQFLMEELSAGFQKEIPQFSPRYLGHMFSELTLPGLLGHFVALLHNPNNISKESSQVGLKIEEEVVQILCRIFNWKKGFGHLTSGGTVANLEALLRMRSQIPRSEWSKAKLLTSTAAHYSWKKNMEILGFNENALLEMPLDSHGKMDMESLEKVITSLSDPLLGVVSLFGSTERGTLDDIHSINKILKKSKKRIWHHVDAAYGGFFACVKASANPRLRLQTLALKQVDSLTLDPHKLGYVPYGCGAFLCQNKTDYFYANVDAPYIQFRSTQETGVQSVEGSRPATGAAATWLTARTLGFDNKGLGRILGRHLKTKTIFEKKLRTEIKNIVLTQGLHLNILCWTVKAKTNKLSDCNILVNKIFKNLPRRKQAYFVSKTSFDLGKNPWLRRQLKENQFQINTTHCHVIRMTLMNPFLLTKEIETPFMDEFIGAVKNLISRN